jgi:hypothetical protein
MERAKACECRDLSVMKRYPSQGDETVSPYGDETVSLPLICIYKNPVITSHLLWITQPPARIGRPKKYGNNNNSDTSSREIMTAKRDESDNRSEQPPKPSLTGDRRLDKALEKLRRTLEAKKEATKQSAAANGRVEHG